MEAQPGETIYPTLDGAPSGLAGTVGIQLLVKADGSVKLARHTTGITEHPAGSGTYIATLTAPVTKGAYLIFWDTGTVTPETVASEDLIVAVNEAAPPTPGGTTSASSAEYQDIHVAAGSTFRRSFVYRDAKGRRVDLSGWKNARMQVRPNYRSNRIALQASNAKEGEGGTIELFSNGVVTVECSPTETGAAKLKGNRGVYSIEVEADDGEVARLFTGNVFLEPDPTR